MFQSFFFWNLPANSVAFIRVQNPHYVSILLLLEFARQLMGGGMSIMKSGGFNPSSSGICPPTNRSPAGEDSTEGFQSFFFWNLPANLSGSTCNTLSGCCFNPSSSGICPPTCGVLQIHTFQNYSFNPSSSGICPPTRKRLYLLYLLMSVSILLLLEFARQLSN